ncbi:sigma-70 family RNA polymerase sigma factor [Nocardia takedensis]|uniref:sigma-70 family RNA polymerase sigma factor n=1 Tax=Nocardia takedensis TaxID=259390 RepID=UPI0002FDCCC9|nr:sigma-70 family RNA polymerase sigma factor [Nocardia takedensis]
MTTATSYDEWLGRPLTQAPSELHHLLFEHVLGVGLAEAAAYAELKARYAIAALDPEMSCTSEDIAQDVLLALTERLPDEPIRHWRGLILRLVEWRVKHLRRERLAQKRYPGRPVPYDDLAEQVGAYPPVDEHERVVAREELRSAIGSVADAETRDVLVATFVIPTSSDEYDVRTTGEVAELLGMSRSKVKRLRAAGVSILRRTLDPDGSGIERHGDT